VIDTKLKNIGYDEFFDSQLESLETRNLFVARVVTEHKGTYKVKNFDGEYLAKVKGKQIFNATKREDYPAVGDWVLISLHGEKEATIYDILTRKTMLKKKYSGKSDIQIIATNIDVVFIIEALDRDYNLNRFERYFILANEGGIKPVIILNKIDLVSDTELRERIEEIKNRFNDVDVILTSTIIEKGINDLLDYIIKGKTYCFIGSSGVGKSSLINKLLDTDSIKTREVSDSTGRGKHTTTSREMYFLDNGGIVIDNPGTREVGVGDTDKGIETVFEAITMLSEQCKYSDCTHINEPKCGVIQAVKDGKLDENKYQNYVKVKKENDFYEMSQIEKRNKDRKFGRFIKKAKEEVKRNK